TFALPGLASHEPLHSPSNVPSHLALGAVAEHVPLQFQLQLPPLSVEPSQVPSHLPWHCTPPCAVHVPLTVASHLPLHWNDAASAAAEPLPLHSTFSVPPVHDGGFAFTSHSALPEHFAWQLAFASIEASQPIDGFSISSEPETAPEA